MALRTLSTEVCIGERFENVLEVVSIHSGFLVPAYYTKIHGFETKFHNLRNFVAMKKDMVER